VPDLLDIETLPSLTSEQAFAIVQKDFDQATEVEFSGEQLTIYDKAIFSDQPAEAKLVWQFTASPSKFSSYTYYVDAQNGDVVKQGSNVIN
jgi:Zn-dependent metalloprotease